MSNDLALEAVNRLYFDHVEYYKFLVDNKQISFAADYKSQFSKVILLASASYFEILVIDSIQKMLNPCQCFLTILFIENKALKRQYHSLFDWEKRSANKFFSYFGSDFKAFMIAQIRDDDGLKQSINDFLELGDLRNQLAHKNYATFNLQLTADEIFVKFASAGQFVDRLVGFSIAFRGAQLERLKEQDELGSPE